MKLPVFRTVGEAYRFAWAERQWMVLLGIIGVIFFIAAGALTLGALWLVIGAPTTADGLQERINEFPPGYAALTVVLIVVVYSAIFVLYSVAWHRRYLLPHERLTSVESWRWRRRHTQFTFSYVKVVASVALIWIATMLVWPLILGGILAAAGAAALFVVISGPVAMAVFLLWFTARLSMLFPASAADEHMDFRTGWRFTRGNAWRLFWIVVLTAIPVTVVLTLLDWLNGLNRVAGNVALWSVELVLIAIQLFVMLSGFAAGITALSIAYRHLREESAAART